MFHLQQPGFEPVIQKHIEAQDLKTGAAAGVVWKTGVVIVLKDGVSGDQSLYNHILNVVPHLLCVGADGLQELVQGREFSTRENMLKRSSI